jgi:predicted ribonuclease YlaK
MQDCFLNLVDKNCLRPVTPFFGREQELEELDRLLANPDCRSISLVGPGGIGKTRLALQAAMNQVNQFA